MDEIRYIDINCDVGEGIGNEHDLLPLISSCSIACGGHAGDTTSMRKVVRLAKEHQVRIGAHPSYPDKENFGRLSMNLSTKELTTSIQNQLADLVTIIQEEKAVLKHIKPHGALYNDLATDAGLVTVFLNAIREFKDSVVLYVPYGSVFETHAAMAGFNVKSEAFADRNYNNDLSLVSRNLPNALITDPKTILKHVLLMVKKGKIRTSDGSEVAVNADTFCLHGDTPDALEILVYLREYLNKSSVHIRIA